MSAPDASCLVESPELRCLSKIQSECCKAGHALESYGLNGSFMDQVLSVPPVLAQSAGVKSVDGIWSSVCGPCLFQLKFHM